MSSQKYILALDQGTTSSRAILFHQHGQPVGISQRPFEQIYPKPGWVEHRPDDIWSSQLGAARDLLRQHHLTPADIAAIGVTNQRETTIVWDRKTGQPIHNAIVWQCRRTADRCDSLRQSHHKALIQEKTGLIVDAYFSASKLEWLLDQVPQARQRAEAGDLAFGTVDTWLIWNLTGGRVHATDVSNASRTMLFNIHTAQWDDELLKLFNIPRSLLPAVVPSSLVIGESDPQLFGGGIPISGVAGDQQAALFGQICTSPGLAKNTYGTGCFMLMNTGTQAVTSNHSLLTTVAWKLGESGELNYALEGSVFIAGAVMQWLRDGLQIIGNAAESDAVAQTVADTGGVYFVPAFVGLGAPYWDQQARGTITGLTRGTTRAHLVRAGLESIAYQTRDVLEAMSADAGISFAQLRVDGGAASNDFLMQFQADMLNVPVIRPKSTETTAAGAAYLAGLAVAYWSDLGELHSLWEKDRLFEPSLAADARETAYSAWKQAIARTLSTTDD
ncbi:MAG TPA: glycerol kinase GlpK [Acidobacteriota bacterium]|nr:glycerol kinase GlpK [Acidobacteriota bacterium]HND19063.1 glycerol kinase GlpK [Acidobacteriota bacterium]